MEPSKIHTEPNKRYVQKATKIMEEQNPVKIRKRLEAHCQGLNMNYIKVDFVVK